MRYFQILGIVILLICSFFYSERVSTTSLLSDDLLTEIKNKASLYKENSVSGIIKNETIILGKSGKKVNIKKSYKEMKEIGYFDENRLVYDKVLPKNSLSKNKNKYIISGNEGNKDVALIFIVNNFKINNIVYKLKNIKATFYIDKNYLKNNSNLIVSLINNGHSIGILNIDEAVWMNTLIKSYGQDNSYCYTDLKNKKLLNNCYLNGSYTIMAKQLDKNQPYIDLKNNLKNGSLVVLNVNNTLDNEIENIINYIQSKGYRIMSLEKFLKE